MPLRTLAFADLAARLWGAVWLPGGAEQGFTCLGAGDATSVPAGRLEGADEHSDWRLLADGTELVVSGGGEPVSVVNADGDGAGFDQLCRVRGQLMLDGAEYAVDCLGRRGVRTDALDAGRLDSVRDVSAWFEPGVALALVSLRPRKARGHESDLITATVLDPEVNRAVADPRLSTTSTSAGAPIRASLELWLGESDDEYPRRAAGAAVGPRAAGSAGELTVQADLFHWESRGHDGAGVYILARPA